MRCVAPSCSNDSGHTGSHDISYYEFPTEPTLLAAWLAAGWRPRQGGAVCSRHFLQQDLLQSGGRRVLRPDAVPVAGALLCRICFAADIKLYSMAEYKSLSTAYETVTGLRLLSEESLPPFLCAECARRLLACARFRARSLQAHTLLLQVAVKFHWITVENIIEHQSLLSPNPTPSQADSCDFDLELLKTEKIYTDEQAEIRKELSLETENDDEPLLKCEISDDVGLLYGEPKHYSLDDDLLLREVKQEPELSDDGVREGVEASTADVDPHRNYELDATYSIVPIEIKLEYIGDRDTPPGKDYSSNYNVPCLEMVQGAELNADGAPEKTEASVAHIDVEGLSANVNLSCDTYQNQINGCNVTYKTNVHSSLRKTACSNDEFKKAFNRRTYLQTHSQPLSGEEVFSCDVCSKSFTAECELKKHVLKHLREKPYICDICSKSFSNRESIIVHLRTQHFCEKPYSCDICNESFPKEYNLNRHRRKHFDKRPHSCDICNMSFPYKSGLERHVRVHSGEKPYACDVCSKSFTSITKLKDHSRLHSGEKPYSCDVCGKSYYTKNTFKIHLRTHSAEKPYSCDVCSKTFTQKGSRDQHKLIHSDEKPHSCDVCGKSFAFSSRLKVHSLIHSGEKPFACDVCSKSFSAKSVLERHKFIHSGEKPYACDVCSKSYSAGDKLKVHLRVHSGERPYSCDICSKSFSVKASLKKHLKTHLGANPYICHVCSVPFTYESSLNLHLQIHSGYK